MEIIKYNPELKITNLDQLARGTGAKYLEVLPVKAKGILIAVKWCRKIPKQFDGNFSLVSF